MSKKATEFQKKEMSNAELQLKSFLKILIEVQYEETLKMQFVT